MKNQKNLLKYYSKVTVFRKIYKGVEFLKSTVLERVLKLNKFLPVQEESRLEKYNSALHELEKRSIRPMHLTEVIQIIRESGKLDLFQEELDELREELLFCSSGHGITHCERVALFAFAIGVLEKVSDEDLRILMESAKYHDIGRIDDNEDKSHGRRSAEKFDEFEIGSTFSKEAKKILKAICIGHSINDEDFEAVMQEFDIKEKENCQKVFKILKDADALDRARLKYSALDLQYLTIDDSIIDMNYLRTNYSKMMIPAAYELYENYQHESELCMEGNFN